MRVSEQRLTFPTNLRGLPLWHGFDGVPKLCLPHILRALRVYPGEFILSLSGHCLAILFTYFDIILLYQRNTRFFTKFSKVVFPSVPEARHLLILTVVLRPLLPR